MELKKRHINFLEGSMIHQVLAFAIPLMIGNIFQQFYNLFDSMIVGNFIGKEALAATGSCSALLSGTIALFSGISLAGTIIIAQYRGAENLEKVSETISTSILFAVAFGIGITILGIIGAPWFLDITNVPELIYQDSYHYLVWYLLGTTCNVVYNIGAAILRGFGDSQRPVSVMMKSSLINIIVDVLFVGVFHFGVIGAAIATVISQFYAAIKILKEIRKLNVQFGLGIHFIKINWKILKEFVLLGLPTGIQNLLVSFSSVFSQSYINQFDETIIAAFSVSNKVERLVNVTTQAFSNTTTTCISQTLGAKDYKRTRLGIKITLLLSCSLTLCLSVFVFIFANPIIQVFNQDKGVIFYGTQCLHYSLLFLPFVCISHTLNGAIRGSGNTKTPMILSIFNMCILRVAFLYIGFKITQRIEVIYLSTAFVNVCSSVICYCYFRCSRWTKEHGLWISRRRKD